MRFVYFLALLFVTTQIFAQEGQLEIKKGFGGVRILQSGTPLKPKVVLGMMQSDSEALAEFKKAKSNYDAAQVIGFAGGFLVGWPLGTAIGGGEPNWGMAAAGAGLILVTIPMSSSYNKHATKAVEIYNGKKGVTGSLPVRLSVRPYVGGVSLRVVF